MPFVGVKGKRMCRLVDIKTNHGEDVRVADVKREEIINIINAASLCKKIDMLILYGSALEDRCTEKSDIDIAVVSKYPISKLCKLKSFHDFTTYVYKFNMNQEYDFLYYKSYDEICRNRESEMIASEIVKKGKIIYKG